MGVRESTLGRALIRECELGHVHKVHELLEEGAAVNFHNETGDTPLTTVIYYGYDDVFDRLIQQPGIDFDMPDVLGRTPLFIAARYDRHHIARRLLRRNVKLDEPQQDGSTAFMWAARQGHLKMLKRLWKAGKGVIDINRRDSNGLTALSGAAKYGHLEIVQYLLTIDGIIINTKDKKGVSTLLHAVTMSNLPMVQSILEVDATSVGDADLSGRTLLLQTSHRGETTIMAEAIQAAGQPSNINANASNEDGITPLMSACMSGNAASTKMILDIEGVRVNQRDANNLTALFHAVLKNKTAPILLLLMRPDVNVNVVDLKGSSVFMQACVACNRYVIDEFLKRSELDINKQDSAGSPAWIYGVEAGRTTEMADALFWNKALDINGLIHFWETPLIHAVRTGNEVIVDALLLRRDLRVNAVDIRSESAPLMWAVRHANITMVNKLLQHPDVAVDMKDGNGDTPLLRAARQGFTDGVLALLGISQTDCEAELATQQSYRRQLLLDREEQIQKNADAAKPLPVEEEDDSDFDDGDEDTEWAGEAAAAAAVAKKDKKSVAKTRTGDTDSLATTDPGVPDHYEPPEAEEESDDETIVNPPDPLLYQKFAEPQVVQAQVDDEARWRDARCTVHARDTHGWSGVTWSAHNGDRPTLLSLLHDLRPPGAPEIKFELIIPEDTGEEQAGALAVEEPSLALSRESVDNVLGSLVDAPIPSDDPAARSVRSGVTGVSKARSLRSSAPRTVPMAEPLGLLSSHWLYSRQLINYRTDDGDAPLMWAVKEDHLHIVKSLLGMPWIDPQATDALGYSALHVATRQCQLEHVTALLRCPHAAPDVLSPDGTSPLMFCIANRYWDMIEAFVGVTRTNVNQHGSDQWTPLTIAVRDADQRLFDLFGECPRTDVNVGNGLGETALMLCSAMGNMTMVKRLMEDQPRCNINAQDKSGQTALMHAIRFGQDHVVKLFLEQPNLSWVTADTQGQTVVTIAKTSPSFIVRRLIRSRDRLLQLVVAWMRHIRDEWAKEENEDEIDYSDF